MFRKAIALFILGFLCHFVWADEPSAEGDAGQTTKQEVEEDPQREEKISLDLRGVEISEFFKILSRRSNLNIIPSSQVKGRINIFLNNINVEDALEVILVSQDLAAERKRNVVYVMTAAEYQQVFGRKYYEKREVHIFKLKAADPQAIFNVFSQIKSDIGKIITDATSATVIVIDVPGAIKDMEESLTKLEELPTQKIFKLNYAKVDEIQGEISNVLTPGLSKLQIDTRTNQLVVSDLPEKMDLIKDVVDAFDEPSKQVFIVAEIVQVVLSDKYEQGISWERLFTDPNMHGLNFAGRYHGDFPLESATTFDATKQGYMSVGTLATDDYHAIFQFLQTIGKTNILSRPRITALNNEEAKILIGTREAYTTGTLSQAESTTVTSENVEFIDVGIKLNVVPRITNDGYVIIKIKPEISVVKEYLETKVLQSRIPIVETSEAETVVKIKDGSMVIIGGLIKKEKSDAFVGIPLLSDIPFIGSLFRSRIKNVKKTELVIFLRPTIVSGESKGLAFVPSSFPAKEEVSFKRSLKGFER